MLVALTLLIGLTENSLAQSEAPEEAAERAAQALPALDLTPELEAAADEVRRYPRDYGAWARLARAAEPVSPQVAAEAWSQAEQLSGGNLEAAAAQVTPRLAIGDVAGAQAASARAAAIAPEDPAVWSLRAEALRHPTGFGGSALAAQRAHAAARQAMALDPHDPISLCAIGWSHARLGDRASAHRAFSQAQGHPCAEDGLEAASLDPRLRQRVWATGIFFPDSLLGGEGLGLTGHVGLRRADRYDMAATARTTLTTSSGLQAELWLSGAVIRGGHGARVVAAGVRGPDDAPEPPPGAPSPPKPSNGVVLGMQAWGTYWATLKLDAHLIRFGDGDGWQTVARLSLPLLDPLRLELGGALSAFDEAPGPNGLVPNDWAAEGPAASGEATLRWSQGPWSAALHGRLGTRYRPAALDLDFLWTLSAASPAALGASAGWDHRSGRRFCLGYDALQLYDPDADTAEWLHVLSVGVNADKELTP